MKRRRQRGEGALYERADGLWTGRFYYTDEMGRRKRATVVRRTMQAAREAMLTRKAEVTADTVQAEQPDEKVSAFLTRWVEDTARLSVRSSTYRQYKSIVQTHLVPGIGHLELRDLGPEHVQRLIAELSTKNVAPKSKKKPAEVRTISPRTAQLAIVVLRRALKQAELWGKVDRNVATAVTKPRVPKKEMRFLTAEQVPKFVEAARDDRLFALYLVAVFCGLREGELLALGWEHVDLDRSELRVEFTLDPQTMQRFEPKTAESRRTVEIPPFVAAELRRHRERMLAEGHPHGTVFADGSGRPIRAGWLLRDSFRPILERAGIDRMRFHDLRHTAAYLMRLAGVDWLAISRRLGHADPAFTMRVYGHLDREMQRGAALALETMFGAIA